MTDVTKTLSLISNNTTISAEFNNTKSELRIMFKRDLTFICTALDKEAAQELYNFLGLTIKKLPSNNIELDTPFLESEEKVS